MMIRVIHFDKKTILQIFKTDCFVVHYTLKTNAYRSFIMFNLFYKIV